MTSITALTPHADTANTRDLATDITLAVIAAIHEAGHAVAYVVVGEVFDRVTIHPDTTGWSGSVDPVPGATIHGSQHLTEAVILLGQVLQPKPSCSSASPTRTATTSWTSSQPAHTTTATKSHP